MHYKRCPQQFFIGLMDFFSILLPGALLQLLRVMAPWFDKHDILDPNIASGGIIGARKWLLIE
jgi:hypothetical protein